VRIDAELVLPDRTSTAERVADLLRERIIVGYFPPGTRLSEEELGAALGISRNTLREAFRLLCHERLAQHELNRGVFVRVPSVEDIVDLYQLRRIVECAAVTQARHAPPNVIAAVSAAVSEGEEAARQEHWSEVGTADLKFHQALAALAGSARVDDLIRGVLAELRLVFHIMASPREFHEPYLVRNREIATLIERGDRRGAERMLRAYLDDAEQQLVSVYQHSARGRDQQRSDLSATPVSTPDNLSGRPAIRRSDGRTRGR
jgi:DNA-binding GntR family transcriptional regulator